MKRGVCFAVPQSLAPDRRARRFELHAVRNAVRYSARRCVLAVAADQLPAVG